MDVWTRQDKPASASASASKGAAATKPLQDPYARWAEATGWRAYRRSPGYGWRGENADKLRIIARAPDVQTLNKALQHGKLVVPPLYRPEGAGTGKSRSKGQVDDKLDAALHFTATLARKDLDWLRQNELNLQWELATPLREAMWTAQTDSRGRYGPQREELPFTLLAGMPVAPQPPLPAVARHSIRKALAVIDFGCPFLNPQFASVDGKGTRVAALWDQQSGPRPTQASWWQEPRAPAYGRELSGEAMNRLCVALRDPPTPLPTPPEEATIYRSLGYLINNDDARRRIYSATHGAHVLDLAAGHPDPLFRLGADDARDAAGEAQLVFVQLPALTAADSSGASLSAQLLDAVRYVLWVCDPQDMIVVNISYGTFAGPHDGSSLIETALAELLRLCGDRLQLVLSAGNAKQADCHARRTVRPDRSALLRMQVQPHDTTETFLEIWYHPQANAALRVRARTTGRDWSDWVLPGEQTALREAATQGLLAMLQHDSPRPGAQQALVLFSLAATEPAVNDDGPLNQPGVWEVEVALQDGHQAPPGGAGVAVRFDAWIERDDPSDRRLGGQPHFVGLDRGDEQHTLSGLATTPGAIVVGGFSILGGTAAPYSSLPLPGDDAKLAMTWAACEEAPGRPGLLASAVRAHETFRMGGTSAAAPVLARRLHRRIAAGRLPKKKAPGGRIDWSAVLKQLCVNGDGFVLQMAPDPEADATGGS